MPQIDLSVIIATWNSREMVLTCLESLFDTVHTVSLEVILVVNGSRDGTQSSVRARFPQVELIENQTNVGFTRANNQGIRRAHGKALLLLNDDTVLLPGNVETLFGYLEAHPDVGAVGPQLVGLDGAKQRCVHNFPSLWNEIVPLYALQRLFPRRYPNKRVRYEEPVEVPAVIGACMMITREAVDKVGLLDERFFSYLEETDWQWRLRQAGYKVVHLPRVTVRHLQGASSKKRFPGATRVEYYRSLYAFFQKHHGSLAWRTMMAVKWFAASLNVLVLFVAFALTGFRKNRLWVRLRSYGYVALWHFKGRPSDMGLSSLRPGGDPPG